MFILEKIKYQSIKENKCKLYSKKALQNNNFKSFFNYYYNDSDNKINIIIYNFSIQIYA